MNRPRGLHLLLLGVLAAGVLAGFWPGFDPRAIPPYSDYWDYLQLGRQIHGGHGFTSLFTYPIFLKHSGDAAFFPELWRPPLFPILVAGAYLFTGGPSLLAPLALQVLGYLLAILGAYLLALQFVERPWALLAALVVALSPDVLGLFEPGIATAPATAALVFTFLLAVRADTRRRALVAGAVLGVLVLLRAEMLLLLPAVFWMLWAGDCGDRPGRIWAFLAGTLLVLAPWIVRGWVVSGRPFSTTASLLFTNTTAFPAWESSRGLDTLDHSAFAWAVTHPGALSAKAVRNAYHFIRQAMLLPLPALAPFAWAAFGRITRVGRESAFCAAVLIGLFVFGLVLSPLEYAPRFLHPFIPLVAVVAVVMLARFREEMTEPAHPALSRRAVVWVAAAVTVLAGLEMVGAVAAARRERARPVDAALARLTPAEWGEVARSLPAGGWAAGDYPAYYAWHTGAKFVWFPVLADFDRMRWRGAAPGAVVLARSRGRSAGDPTGIPSTPALAETLAARGWTVDGTGPIAVLQRP